MVDGSVSYARLLELFCSLVIGKGARSTGIPTAPRYNHYMTSEFGKPTRKEVEAACNALDRSYDEGLQGSQRIIYLLARNQLSQFKDIVALKYSIEQSIIYAPDPIGNDEKHSRLDNPISKQEELLQKIVILPWDDLLHRAFAAITSLVEFLSSSDAQQMQENDCLILAAIVSGDIDKDLIASEEAVEILSALKNDRLTRLGVDHAYRFLPEFSKLSELPDMGPPRIRDRLKTVDWDEARQQIAEITAECDEIVESIRICHQAPNERMKGDISAKEYFGGYFGLEWIGWRYFKHKGEVKIKWPGDIGANTDVDDVKENTDYSDNPQEPDGSADDLTRQFKIEKTIHWSQQNEKTYELRHKILQNKLYDYLRTCHEKVFVRYEENYVDLRVNVDPVTIYEIKVYQSTKQCIREALGQLLEYCHYPKDYRAKRLVVVGEAIPQHDDVVYLCHLRETYKLNLYYQRFDMENNCLDGEI